MDAEGNMSIIEMIAFAGEENCGAQWLNQCMTNAKFVRSQNATELSFITDALTCNDIMLNTGSVGLVIWLPREKVIAMAARQPKKKKAKS